MKAEFFLPDDYRPAEDEPFMNERQLEWFRREGVQPVFIRYPRDDRTFAQANRALARIRARAAGRQRLGSAGPLQPSAASSRAQMLRAAAPESCWPTTERHR